MLKDCFAGTSGPHPYLQGLAPAVEEIARQAGAIILGHYGKNCRLEIKDDASPVTQADHEASAHIVTTLSRITPNIPVISEENNTMPHPAHPVTYWAVDPLDGTREFIEQTGGFAVKIALIAEARPALGVIYCPVQGVLYSGVAGGPALKSVDGQAAQEIHTRPACPQTPLRVLFNRKHADPALYDRCRAHLSPAGVALPADPEIVPGLPRVMQVAEGTADMVAGTGHERGSGYVWDVAADEVILTNAGGALYWHTLKSGILYDRPRALVPGYLAFGDRKLAEKAGMHR